MPGAVVQRQDGSGSNSPDRGSIPLGSPINPDDLVFEVSGEPRQFGVRRKGPRPTVEKADPLRRALGKRNRRNGNAAALEWARLVGGENVGLLGREDIREADMLWEVKAGPRPQLGLLEKALDQVEAHAARRNLPCGVAWRLPGRPLNSRWLVVMRHSSWLDLHAGLSPPRV